MKLSAKGRYAIKALVNIATNKSDTPKTLLEISISGDFALLSRAAFFSVERTTLLAV